MEEAINKSGRRKHHLDYNNLLHYQYYVNIVDCHLTAVNIFEDTKYQTAALLALHIGDYSRLKLFLF